MSYTVSHFEIRAHDRKVMEKFYTEGFIVSDRGDAAKLAGFSTTEDWQRAFDRRFEPAE